MPDAEIEQIAVREAMEHERRLGWVVESVETENRGYDLLSKKPHPTEPGVFVAARFIEVKGRAGVGEVALSSNEYRTAQRLGDDYWLYVVFDCGTTPKLNSVQNPAKLGWEPIVRVEHYHVAANAILEAAVSEAPRYPKRLIEVDLPITRISEHARREKSIRHGHISTLHIWWARRPLAACRAVICASLWSDPTDPVCPESFREAARREMLSWTTHERQKLLSDDSRPRFEAARKCPARFDNACELRQALLDFIADFSNWDNSAEQHFLDSGRALTSAAHVSLGGACGTHPLVVDPFAGGGAIPLEALRVGADAFASDLNPIPVLLNNVLLEYIPRYGGALASHVRRSGIWIQEKAREQLGEFYPTDADGARPIAYLWARTIRCEGPSCGAEVPLLRSLSLARRGSRSLSLKISAEKSSRAVEFSIVDEAPGSGTVRKGAATCPVCGYTTPNQRVRAQLAEKSSGVIDARLVAVVTTPPGQQGGRGYRLGNDADVRAVAAAASALERTKAANGFHGAVPNESIPPERPSPKARGLSAVTRIGARKFADLFTPRQILAISTFSRLIHDSYLRVLDETGDQVLATAVQTVLAFGLDRLIDRSSALCRWDRTPTASGIINTFSRQALPIVWDFAEGVPFESRSGGWLPALEWTALVIEREGQACHQSGRVQQASAANHPLASDMAQALVTDSPYYDAIPYADLSDFFYVWLRRSLPNTRLLAEPIRKILTDVRTFRKQTISVRR